MHRRVTYIVLDGRFREFWISRPKTFDNAEMTMIRAKSRVLAQIKVPVISIEGPILTQRISIIERRIGSSAIAATAEMKSAIMPAGCPTITFSKRFEENIVDTADLSELFNALAIVAATAAQLPLSRRILIFRSSATSLPG